MWRLWHITHWLFLIFFLKTLLLFFGSALLFLVSSSACPLKTGQAARERVATEETA
jgi:hypothetical protein